MKTKSITLTTPDPHRFQTLCAKLMKLQNELDAMTFEAPQEYRDALYPLCDCVGIMEELINPPKGAK